MKPLLLGSLSVPLVLGAVPAHAQEATEPAPTTAAANDAAAVAWPQFRGRNACGIADGFTVPIEWHVETGENLAWKTKIPGLSHSSPVIWGDRIFVTTAVRDGKAELKVGLYGSIESVEDDSNHEFQLLCLDRTSGEIAWTRTCWKGVPAIKRHPKGSHAVSSPATDGERVLAFFGTEGLYCYGMDGELKWKKDLGRLDAGFFRDVTAQWGFGSSPVIHDGRVIVQCDVQKGSFLAMLDLATGDFVWRSERTEVPTWGTPTVAITDERSQIVVNGWKHMGGYDLATGKELWKLAGGGDIPVPTPIAAHGLIYLTSAHGRKSPVLAIAADANGELGLDATQHEDVVWSIQRGGNYMQTPICYGDYLYCCRDNGSLSCFDARSGERLYRERLGTGYTGYSASGVAADGKLYFPSELGEIYVIEAGPEFKQLAVNELGETCMASPAISRGVIYFRTRSHLIAVGN